MHWYEFGISDWFKRKKEKIIVFMYRLWTWCVVEVMNNFIIKRNSKLLCINYKRI
ncbi:protein of unknown function [Clostridium beijerinckii]|nr:protein of unknown function [Clostridium beijerinckii]